VPPASGRLHRPDDAQAESRAADGSRRTAALIARETPGSPRFRSRRRGEPHDPFHDGAACARTAAMATRRNFGRAGGTCPSAASTVRAPWYVRSPGARGMLSVERAEALIASPNWRSGRAASTARCPAAVCPARGVIRGAAGKESLFGVVATSSGRLPFSSLSGCAVCGSVVPCPASF